MSYNIRVGINHRQGLEAVARVVAAEAPDLVGLQEVDANHPRTGRVEQAAWLGQRLAMQARFGPAHFWEDSGGAYGNAVLVREGLGIDASESLALPLPGYPPGTEGRLLEPRGALAVHLEPGLWVVSTHLGLEPGQRRLQAERLAELLEELEGPVVLMGDFNALPGSRELEPLAGLQDAYAALEGQPPLTYPSGAYGARDKDGWRGCIDFVFLRGLRLVRTRVVYDQARASDHNPVVADVEP